MTEKLIEKMIVFYKGNMHDIEHFLKVYAYAGLIGKLEGLDRDTQELLEQTAVVHDIACPLCREKYNDDCGANQEKESEGLLRPFLEEYDLNSETKERIIALVCHHHTYSPVLGIDHQILLEADFLVNASEQHMSREKIRHFYDMVVKTTSGKRLFEEIYLATMS